MRPTSQAKEITDRANGVQVRELLEKFNEAVYQASLRDLYSVDLTDVTADSLTKNICYRELTEKLKYKVKICHRRWILEWSDL